MIAEMEGCQLGHHHLETIEECQEIEDAVEVVWVEMTVDEVGDVENEKEGVVDVDGFEKNPSQ